MQYVTTIVSYAGSDTPGNRWKNVFEWDVPSSLTFDADIAHQLNYVASGFVYRMSLESTIISRGVTGSYGADLLPGVEFVTDAYGITGAVPLGGQEPMASTVVLEVLKNTSYGRVGRFYMRGAVTEADAIYAGANWTARPQVVDRLDAAWASFQTEQAAVGATLSLVSGTSLLPLVRAVSGMAIGKITTRKMSRRAVNAVPRSGPVGALVNAISAMQDNAPVINAVIEAYNALPLSDLPLLPE